ncbi:hypothetical protein EBR66_02115 [bacterium]|nr:hypothetical protein [bacterium]
MKLVSRLNSFFERHVPTPHFLLPDAFGVDVSDTSVKWMAFERAFEGFRVKSFGSVTIPDGVVEQGTIRDSQVFSRVLSEVARKNRIAYAHVALPEEAAFVFRMQIPVGTPRDQALNIIEFELEGRVPLPPSSTVFDYDILSAGDADGHHEIGVVVFPRELAERYATAFAHAGITLLSLEIEARSIARAVTGEERETALIVDYGLSRTGLAVVKSGVPIFTSTVDVGGEVITKQVMETLKVERKEAGRIENDEGLFAVPDGHNIAPIANTHVNGLADAVARAYRFWDTRRDKHGEAVSPLSRIILVGGSSNLYGLEDYLAGKVQAPVEQGNVWKNICTFDSYLPPIDKRTSLQYATAVGLALRNYL